eukprot:7456018-Heterocapsa_arctica.AAC.1
MGAWSTWGVMWTRWTRSTRKAATGAPPRSAGRAPPGWDPARAGTARASPFAIPPVRPEHRWGDLHRLHHEQPHTSNSPADPVPE